MYMNVVWCSIYLCIVYCVLCIVLVGMTDSYKASANMYTYVIDWMCMVIMYFSVCVDLISGICCLLPGVCNLGSVWYIVQCLCYAGGKYMIVWYIYIYICNIVRVISSNGCEWYGTRRGGCCMYCICCIM